MEKYRRYADAATGIQPFLPPHIPHKNVNILVRLALGLVRGAVGLVRFAMTVVSMSMLCVVTLVLHVLLLPIPPLRHQVFALVHAVLCRLVLFALGFVSVDFKQVSQRYGTKVPPANVVGDMAVRTGDVVICNHCSYVDILYLGARYSPVFVVPFASGTGAGGSKDLGTVTLAARGLLSTLWSVMSKDVDNKAPSNQTLAEIMANASRPVLLLPEGTTTNNKTILDFLPVFDTLPAAVGDGNDSKKKRVHIHALKYDDPTRTTYTVGAGWARHMFVMGTNAVNRLEVKTVIREDIPLFSRFPDVKQWAEAVRVLMGEKLVKIQPGTVSVVAKKALVEYYNQTQASDYTKKQE